PDTPIIVALTGTDLYGEMGRRRSHVCESLELATRIVGLQPKAPDALGPQLREKTRVIYQSVAALNNKALNYKARASAPDPEPSPSKRRPSPLSSRAPATFAVC